MQSFAKRNRQKFELFLQIIDLNNVPLVSGTSFIKWYLPHSAAAEHRGRTSKCQIKEHKVCYDYTKTVPIRLTTDKYGVLNDAMISFEIIQEYQSGSRAERIVLGNVSLNLAEYVGAREPDGEEGLTRRYLMQNSKINSTLKISVCMKFLEGDKNFTVPTLKSAPVFGGIAGIMTGEQGDVDDVGHMPSLSKKSREASELQDMYRNTLAAYWTALPGELKADECIENIFAGGNGWGSSRSQTNQPAPKEHVSGEARGPLADIFSKKSRHSGYGSNETIKESDKPKMRAMGWSSSPASVSGRGSLEQHASQFKAEAELHRKRSSNTLDELEIREDLRSWKLPSAVQ